MHRGLRASAKLTAKMPRGEPQFLFSTIAAVVNRAAYQFRLPSYTRAVTFGHHRASGIHLDAHLAHCFAYLWARALA